MRLYGLCAFLLLVAVWAMPLQAQTAPDWSGAWDNIAAFARSNPLHYIAELANLPPQAQKVYLAVIGERLKQQTHGTCNIFGGEASCMQLPSDSPFAQVCPEHNLKVDCAYYSDDLQEVRMNPAEEIRDALRRNSSAGLEENCEQCFDNLRQLWCAQTAPKCGSFQGAVEGAVLPAITTVLTAADNGRTPLDALSEAVPSLLQASNLALPCREMCEAVVSTCSCNKQRKFGPLLEKVNAAISAGGSGLPPLPKGFTKQLFGGLYKQPICSLYARSNAKGFTGQCTKDLPKKCTYQEKWCGKDGSNAGSDLVEELMALQIAKGLFGWVDSIWADESEVINGADDSQLKKLEDEYLKHSKPRRQGGWEDALVPVLLILAASPVVMLGIVFWIHFARRREQRRLAAIEELADEDSYDLLQPINEPPSRRETTGL